jgi:hypothetical protein
MDNFYKIRNREMLYLDKEKTLIFLNDMIKKSDEEENVVKFESFSMILEKINNGDFDIQNENKPKSYHYFVSYTCKNGGSGNAETVSDKPIENHQDILKIQRIYENELGLEENSVLITNFQLFK